MTSSVDASLIIFNCFSAVMSLSQSLFHVLSIVTLSCLSLYCIVTYIFTVSIGLLYCIIVLLLKYCKICAVVTHSSQAT